MFLSLLFSFGEQSKDVLGIQAVGWLLAVWMVLSGKNLAGERRSACRQIFVGRSERRRSSHFSDTVTDLISVSVKLLLGI